MKKVVIIILVFISSKSFGQTLNLIPYKCEDKWGYCNIEGEEKITPKYDTVQLFSGKLAIVGVAGKYGMINVQGQKVLPCIFAEIEPYNTENKCFRAKKKNKWSVYNEQGKKIRKNKFHYSTLYDCFRYGPLGGMANIFLYSKNGKYGFVSFKCDNILSDSCRIYSKPEYTDYIEIGSNILALESLGIWSLYYYTGEQAFEREYELIDSVAIGRKNKQYYRVGSNGKFGLIDSNGEELVKPLYSNIDVLPSIFYHHSKEWYWSDQQLFKVTLDQEIFYINQEGVQYNCKAK